MGFLLLSGLSISAPAHAVAPEAPPPTYTVAMTAYNAVPSQTDSSPYVTASGAFSNPEVVAARSQDLANELPFGTIIEIDGPVDKQHNCGYDVVNPLIGYRVIADSMNIRFTNRVDVLFDTKDVFTLAGGKTMNASTVLGVCKDVTIRVVGHIEPAQLGHLPKTQAELASIVTGSSGSLALK